MAEYGDESVDPIEAFAEGYKDIPQDKPILQPEVWALAEVASVKARMNTWRKVPELVTTFKILESAVDEEGNKAYGRHTEYLQNIPSGHPGVHEVAQRIQTQRFGAATRVLLCPPSVKDKDQQDEAVLAAARSAGGFDKAMVGRKALVHFKVNDGTNAKGEIKSPKLNEEPKSEIDRYEWATEEQIAKKVRAGGGAMAGATL